MATTGADHPSDLDAAAVRTAAAAARDWLAARRDHLRVPGVQAALALRGELLLSTAAGVADEGTGEPLRTDHLFRVASHSKAFAATLVLRLAHAGALSLEDRLGRWVPELVAAGSPAAQVPLRALLEHTSGLARDSVEGAGHGDADHWQGERPFPDRAELLAVLSAPGVAVLGVYERFKYSNLGYAALGLVLEAAIGRPWAQLVRTELLEPLGLRRTEPSWVPARAAEHASGHTLAALGGARRPVVWDALTADARAMDAATGVSSTAEDLVRWASAHCDVPAAGGPGGQDDDEGRVLPAHLRRLARQGAWATDDPSGDGPAASGDEYGLGWQRLTAGGRRTAGHGGGYFGHATRTAFDPATGLAVAVCTNAVDGPALPLARGVLRLVEIATTGAPDPAAARPGALERFTGRFASQWGVLDVVRLGDRLVALDPVADVPGPVAELRVAGDDALLVTAAPGFAAPGELLRYTFDDTGRTTTVRGAGGITHRPTPGPQPRA
ncbi:beta-lactamase family protein [Streptomyces sp. NP160]|uniref:serine hydrolase domain-containing protein n=1 Tax=Streptomyces sp. NP160 TaxID=2586637 RepID=UPI00111B45A0|nr:serine hydrolase domain-containing protein [Streptomyces sp. NP160]TNM60021.1 beta-lactamase family protein [Streptomyces sp. NP160]